MTNPPNDQRNNDPSNNLDMDRIHADIVGMENRLHFDHAGSSLMPRPVVQCMVDHLELESRLGGYVAQERKSAELAESYSLIAQLIHAQPSEIAILPSATDAWGRAFYSLKLGPGDKVVTAFNEYCSNFVSLLDRQQKSGIEIIVIGPDEKGELDLAAMEAALDDRVKVIAISHVPSSSGQINPVHEVGKLARRHHIPFLLDACQSVGQLPIDVEAIGCDMLTATGRKFLRGPRGSGFLYIRKSLQSRLEPVMLTNQAALWVSAHSYQLRTDAQVMEAWERNVAAQLGLAEAVRYLLNIGVKAASDRSHDLPGFRLTDPGHKHSAIITCQHDRLSPQEIKVALEQRNIAVQVASVMHTRLDLEARGIESALRLSPHYINHDEDIGLLCEALAAL
jgi:selenocysteine lyase/cysteine desulfurase